MIRTIIINKSAFIRKKLREILDCEAGVTVVAAVRSCREALPLMQEFLPDIIIADMHISCPNERLGLCRAIRDAGRPIIVTGLADQEEEARKEFRALRASGFAFAPLPDNALELNGEHGHAAFAQTLKHALALLAPKGHIMERDAHEDRCMLPPAATHNAVAIGLSTGGPRTIMSVLPRLPASLNAPVFLVQHMPPEFTATFAARLNEACALTVCEARDNETVQNGTVYIAPGDRHLTVRRSAHGTAVCRLSETPRTLFMPSVNVMMNSVLDVFGARTIGVLMTGMGSDGAEAMVRIRQAGGYTMTESRETCVVWGMPREAEERGGADIVLPSHRIAEAIMERLNALDA